MRNKFTAIPSVSKTSLLTLTKISKRPLKFSLVQWQRDLEKDRIVYSTLTTMTKYSTSRSIVCLKAIKWGALSKSRTQSSTIYIRTDVLIYVFITTFQSGTDTFFSVLWIRATLNGFRILTIYLKYVGRLFSCLGRSLFFLVLFAYLYYRWY